MKPREEINQELSRDPEIAPVMTHNLLFIDISSYTRPETANKVYNTLYQEFTLPCLSFY